MIIPEITPAYMAWRGAELKERRNSGKLCFAPAFLVLYSTVRVYHELLKCPIFASRHDPQKLLGLGYGQPHVITMRHGLQYGLKTLKIFNTHGR